MASKSAYTYGERAKTVDNPLAKKLLEVAEEKQSNLVVSADLSTTAELLDIANSESPSIMYFSQKKCTLSFRQAHQAQRDR